MRTEFLGAAYTSRSLPLAAQTLINLFYEPSVPGSAEAGMFYGSPGLALFATLGTGPIRGGKTAGSNSYFVSGTTLYKLTSAGVSTSLGSIPGTGRCHLVANDTQLVVMHSAGWHLLTLATDALASVPDAPTTAQGCYQDSYVIGPRGDGPYVWTAIGNAGSLDALDFASAEANPDPIIAVLSDHGELLNFGEVSLEVMVPTGNADMPFVRRQLIEHGCAAKYSPAKADNTVFWLGRDDNGRGVVFRLDGAGPSRVSTFALETAIAGYADISTAWGHCYQQNGHTFYVLTFDEATWAFDMGTGRWSQLAYRDPNTGDLERHRGNAYAFLGGRHLLGDHENGNVYRLDLDTYTDNGDAIYWERAWSVIESEGRWIRHDTLQLMAEMGVGLNDGQGSDPIVLLSWSDDGCRTWSNDRELRLGAIGRFRTRAIARRLGISRNRVYRIRGTDPVKKALYGANLDAQPAGR